MKKTFSSWSVVLVVIGLLAFIINWLTTGIIEFVVITGFIFLLLGAIFSLIAFVKREPGGLKIVSAVSFFIMLFVLTMVDPLLFVYMMTWLKQIF